MPAPLSESANRNRAPETGSASQSVHAMFFVTADAGPGIAPRLIEPFAKLGLTPARLHISSEDGAGDDLNADLRVRDVTRGTAQKIDKALRAIVGVRQVIALVE